MLNHKEKEMVLRAIRDMRERLAVGPKPRKRSESEAEYIYRVKEFHESGAAFLNYALRCFRDHVIDELRFNRETLN